MPHFQADLQADARDHLQGQPQRGGQAGVQDDLQSDLEAIARIAKDLSKGLDAKDLIASLNALDKTSSAQRLGFIFDRMKFREHARHIAKWLHGRPDFKTPQPLELGAAKAGNTELDSRWKIRYTSEHLSLMEELK